MFSGSFTFGVGLSLNFFCLASIFIPTGIGLNCMAGGTLFESGNFLIASKSVSWFFNPDASISIFESEKSRPMSFSASATVSRVMVLVLVWQWVSVGVRKRAANGRTRKWRIGWMG